MKIYLIVDITCIKAEQAKLKACLLLSNERLRKDTKIIELTIKKLGITENKNLISSIKSVGLNNCIEFITIEKAVQLLKEKDSINPMTDENKKLLDYENSHVTMFSKHPEEYASIFKSLGEKMEKMYSEGLYSKELSNEELDELLKKNREKSERLKNIHNDVKYKLNDLNDRWFYHKIVNSYNNLDDSSKFFANMFLLCLLIFVLVKVLKLIFIFFFTKKKKKLIAKSK